MSRSADAAALRDEMLETLRDFFNDRYGPMDGVHTIAAASATLMTASMLYFLGRGVPAGDVAGLVIEATNRSTALLKQIGDDWHARN